MVPWPLPCWLLNMLVCILTKRALTLRSCFGASKLSTQLSANWVLCHKRGSEKSIWLVISFRVLIPGILVGRPFKINKIADFHQHSLNIHLSLGCLWFAHLWLLKMTCAIFQSWCHWLFLEKHLGTTSPPLFPPLFDTPSKCKCY